MDLFYRTLKDEDYYDYLILWWEQWGWTPPQKDFLPSGPFQGIIVFDQETPVCAAYVYTTNSAVAWIDWVISNPNYRKKPHRKQAIKMVIEVCEQVLKTTGGIKYVYALIKNTSLIETYKSCGYVQGDKYQTEMIKPI
jgi:hypothetical protein